MTREPFPADIVETRERGRSGSEEGTFGGHGTVAGGSIQLGTADSRAMKRLERRLERNIVDII